MHLVNVLWHCTETFIQRIRGFSH